MDAVWLQSYNPLHSPALSTTLAALPVLLLLGSIALLRIRIHYSALIGLVAALAVALGVYQMLALGTVTKYSGTDATLGLALAVLMGLLVLLQAYVVPFSRLVVP